MCDIFTQKDLLERLAGKSYLFIGDSIMRNLYKDLVWLTTSEREEFIPTRHMQKKGEKNLGNLREERLITGGDGTAGRDYEEVRDFYSRKYDLQYSFCFITRCWSDKLGYFIEQYPEKYGSYPDVIMINSALWDINRWGTTGTRHFRYNIHYLLNHLKWCLRKAPHCQVIWMTTPPISTDIRGGFMLNQLDFQKLAMRANIMEGNQYAANAAAAYGFDVLDMHYYMLHQIHRRAADGIHWNAEAVRMQVNVFLTHFCLSRKIPLLNRWKKSRNLEMKENCLLEEAKLALKAASTDYLNRQRNRKRLQKRTFAHAHRRKHYQGYRNSLEHHR